MEKGGGGGGGGHSGQRTCITHIMGALFIYKYKEAST